MADGARTNVRFIQRAVVHTELRVSGGQQRNERACAPHVVAARDEVFSASVRSIVTRFAVASAAVLALVMLVVIRTNGEFGPTTLALLTFLLAVQVPFVWQMATRLRAVSTNRPGLPIGTASDRHHLHDSIVQDLSGVSFNLAALGRNQSIDPADVAEAAEWLRTALGSFRFVLDETLFDR